MRVGCILVKLCMEVLTLKEPAFNNESKTRNRNTKKGIHASIDQQVWEQQVT